MAPVQEEIPVEKARGGGSTGIGATQKYDAAQIDKKIPTRRVFALTTSFSSISTISLTVPSAAATIRLGSVADARSGSRKKATVQKISSKKSMDNHGHTNQAATAANAKNARIQRASKSVWKRIKEVYFPGLKEAGQGSKNE